MSTHKAIDRICVAVLVCTLLLTVLFINGKRFGLVPVVDGDAESSTDSVFFTRNDRSGSWESAGATSITLSGDHASVSGGGAYVYDGDVVIAQAGRYVISGTLDDGSIIVSAGGSDKVWLLLNGAELHCADNACLRVEQADKVFLTLAADTRNSMSSGAAYSESAIADNVGGVLFSRDDLTINGSGSLAITAAYKHGIDVNDELVITGGSVSVDAPQDAVHTNDGLRIENAVLQLRSGDEGLSLQGENALLYIASGSFEIDSGGTSVKSAGELLIEGGSFTINADADGVHGGGSVAVTGGNFTISAEDDGIHADKMVSVSGGKVTLSACYEGIEALTIDIMGGEIEIYPSDDGLNANGGSGFGPPGMLGQSVKTDGGTEEETWIHISGGSLTIVNKTARDADGLDSNGDILISGGSVRVSVPGSGSNNAIDFGSEGGGVCAISGGDLVACGASMMAENLSDSSAQCSIFYSLGYTAEAETTVRLKDASGKVLLSYTAPCSFSTVALSCPEMRLGESYTVVIGEQEEQITLETVNTTNSAGGGFGGFGGPGGFGGQGQRDWSAMDVDDEEHPTRRGRGMGAGPEGTNPSNMPAPPDFGGETPDFSNMPAPPDFDASGFPDMPSDFGDDRQQSGQKPGPAQNEMTQPESAASETDETLRAEGVEPGPEPVSASSWRMIGAAFLVLAAGILFAVKYKV